MTTKNSPNVSVPQGAHVQSPVPSDLASAAFALVARRNLEEHIAAARADGIGFSACLESFLLGADNALPAAPDSVLGRFAGRRDALFGELFAALEEIAEPTARLLRDDAAFERAVLEELFAPTSTGDISARNVAEILRRALERARADLRGMGIEPDSPDGRPPLLHDPWKMARKRADGTSPRQAWSRAAVNLLDLDRVFPGLAASFPAGIDDEQLQSLLNDLYDALLSGPDVFPTGTARAGGAGLYFKSPEAFIAYRAEFCRGNVLDGVLHHLETAARTGTLMETLGPRPGALLRELAEEHGASAREKKRLDDLLALLTGTADNPLSPSSARIISLARAGRALAECGEAALSAVGDVFVKAMSMRVHDRSWPGTLTECAARYLARYRGREREAARQTAAFARAVIAEICLGRTPHEPLPGRAADLRDKLRRWSGLDLPAESLKAGYAMWFSEYLGELSDRAFADLPPVCRAMLEYHGLDAGHWELLRLMGEDAEDGRGILAPEKAHDLPDEAVRVFLRARHAVPGAGLENEAGGFIRTEALLLERVRRELRDAVMGMIADETLFAVNGPESTRHAPELRKPRPDMAPGGFPRALMCCGSFPMTYMQRLRNDSNTGAVGRAFTRDIPAVVETSLFALAFGYLAMAAEAFAAGRPLRDPAKPQSVAEALIQSGAAGILGDFLLGKAGRFGNTLPERDADALRVTLDTTPMVNLRYTRDALNWSLVYHIREMLSPGALDRTERKMREEFRQGSVFPALEQANTLSGPAGL